MYNRVSLKNFDAEKIYVISDPANEQRRLDFIEAWSGFSDFDFEFVDAVMAKDIDINKLYLQGKISDQFYDPNACLSKTVFAIALSHEKVWQKIWDLHQFRQTDERFLILEDDARPTKSLCKDIFNGRYKKLLKSLERFRTDVFIWGKKEEVISICTYTNQFFGEPTYLADTSGHAYMINRSVAFELIDKQSTIWKAVDVLIEEVGQRRKWKAPYRSYIRQQGNLLGKFIMRPDDKDFMYSSSSSRNSYIHGKLEASNPLRFIDPSILGFVKSVENLGYQNNVINLKFKDLI